MKRHHSGRPPWHRRLSGHGTLWVLAAAVVAVVVALAGVAIVRSERVRRDLSSGTDRYLEPGRHLADAQRSTFSQEQDALELYDGSATGAVRAANVFAFNQASRAVADAWTSYRRRDAGFPDEPRLQSRFDGAVNRANALVSRLLAGTAAPGDSDVYRAVVAQQQSALSDLRDRYAAALQASVARANGHAAVSEDEMVWLAVGAGSLLLVLFGFAIGTARARERVIRTREHERVKQAERNDLEARLGRALEMATAEPAVYDLVADALHESLRGTSEVDAELLVAGTDGGHLRRVAATRPEGAGCGVGLAAECPVASRSRTEVFPTSGALDACPYLRGRPSGACSAVCVPVSIAGTSIGVLHATAVDGAPPDADALASFELIANRAAERIGMQRAFARSQRQARTDPLTGLLNRRSLESEARRVLDRDTPYVIAYGDLDHFKRLNDEHGHDAGDRALRLFARVLRDGVRPDDLPARYGGEEFLVVLPDCALDDALAVIDRIRDRLHDAQRAGGGPSFTVSFGLAASDPADTFAEAVERADGALLRAKAAGRNRTLVDGSPEGPGPNVGTSASRLREVG